MLFKLKLSNTNLQNYRLQLTSLCFYYLGQVRAFMPMQIIITIADLKLKGISFPPSLPHPAQNQAFH